MILCKSVFGILNALTEHFMLGSGWRARAAVSNYVFFDTRSKNSRAPPNWSCLRPLVALLPTVGLIKVTSCLGNMNWRRRHRLGQGNRARAVPISCLNLLRSSSVKPGLLQRKNLVVCIFTGCLYLGCRMIASREPGSPRGQAEGIVKTG